MGALVGAAKSQGCSLAGLLLGDLPGIPLLGPDELQPLMDKAKADQQLPEHALDLLPGE